MLDRLKKLLASPRFPSIAAALAVLLFLPVLNVGFILDDYFHRVTYVGGLQIVPRPNWDMFRFVGPDRAEFAKSLEFGAVPWWTPPDYKLAFFRPLAAMSHWFDYHYFPDHPGVMHAENILLFAGMVIFAGLLYRRFLAPAWVAGLAALLFAWDDAHSGVVVWIANRNAILAGLFGLLALWLHDRKRRDGNASAGVLAPLALALALLSGEAAVATLGYLAAYALFLDDKPTRSRLTSLAPYAGIAGLWVAVYKTLGYGTSRGGFYVDPGGEPVAFVVALVKRLPVLLLAQFGLPPADLWPQTPAPNVVALLVTTAFLLGLGVIFARVLRKDRTCLFFATGMLFSLVPVCATWPNDRLLLFSGFGAFGLIASFLARAFAVTGRERFLTRAAVGLMVLIHVVLAPLLLPVRARTLGTLLHEYVESAVRSMPVSPGATYVVVNAPDPLVANMAGGVRYYEDPQLMEKGLRQLSIVAFGEETLERVDDHTVILTASHGFFNDPFSQIFRSPSLPFHVGDVVTLKGMRTEILEVGAEGLPRRIQVHFDASLDDPSLVWLTWEKTGFVPFKVPGRGERVFVPLTSFVEALAGKKP
jgi:hypothetical protein